MLSRAKDTLFQLDVGKSCPTLRQVSSFATIGLFSGDSMMQTFLFLNIRLSIKL